MASSSLSHRRNEEHHAFSGIEPQRKRRKVEESSKLFDVYINHRGPDVKETVALELYKSFTRLGLHAFLDSEEKEIGCSFTSTAEKAIHSASAHIAIFSKRYAQSAWCLAELLLMFQSGAKIFPVFYGVESRDLRHIETGVYAEAFAIHKEKKRYTENLEEWKKALQSVGFITGYEISSNFNTSDCQNIVLAVQTEIQRKKPLHVAKYPVGLHRLVEDFERQCCTNEDGKEKAQIVGIFGMSGVGKTTLAKELFNRKRLLYDAACFLFDVREAYANNNFPSLQMKLLKDLFQEDGLNFQSTEEGRSRITGYIRRSNQLSFLIVVDDIDHVQQLDDLLIMDKLENSVNCLVIVTTRDVGVIINAGITVAYNLKGMDRDDATELFCWNAFRQPYPANDYENLVNLFLNVCGGLPLSLQVLASHVRGRDQSYWSLELNSLNKTLPRDIYQRLKKSFDELGYEEQQIFMDIACFFVDQSKSIAMEVWKASGWSAQHALETLRNKCLVQERVSEEGGEERCALRMHEHLRDLGREMADGLSRPRRLWRPRDLEYLESKGFRNILAQTKGRCFHSFVDESMKCRITYLLGESDVSADMSPSLLWLELQYMNMQNQHQLNLDCIMDYIGLKPSIPTWIPLQNLRYLIIRNLHCKTLWQSPIQPSILSWILPLLHKTLEQRRVQVLTQLKELRVYDTSLRNISDFSGMSDSLEILIIHNCNGLKTVPGLSDLKNLIELNISNCQDVQELSVGHLRCLKRIVLHNCNGLKSVPGLSDLEKLIELNISNCQNVQELSVAHLRCLERTVLDNCNGLKIVPGLSDLKKLIDLNISNCQDLQELSVGHLSCLERIVVHSCNDLKSVSGLSDLKKLIELSISNCQGIQELNVAHSSCLERIVLHHCYILETVSGISDLTKLEELNISQCPKLKQLRLVGLKSLKRIKVEGPDGLETVTLDGSRLCWNKEAVNFFDRSY